MTESAEDRVRRIQLEARSEVVRRAGVAETALDEAWSPIFEALAEDIAAASPTEVRQLIAAALQEAVFAALPIIAAAIRDGGDIGARSATLEHAVLAGPGGILIAAAEAAGLTPEDIALAEAAAASRVVETGAEAAAAAGRSVRTTAATAERASAAEAAAEARIAGARTPDRIRLSRRLYRRAAIVADEAAIVVRSPLEARTGPSEPADALIEAAGADFVVPIPEYVRDLEAAALRSIDAHDRRFIREAIRRHRRQLERLGEGALGRDGAYSLRSTAREFARRLSTAEHPEQVARIVDRHVADRAQYQALRIVRHETGEAAREAYIESTSRHPYVRGFRWELAPSHPRADVCDCMANQSLYGLGPGGYPVGAVPDTPHPGCLCIQTAIPDTNHFRRELARARGEEEPPRPWEDDRRETASEWVARQPRRLQRELLGPTRLRLLDEHGPSGAVRVIDDDGIPIPVSRVLSSARGARSTG